MIGYNRMMNTTPYAPPGAPQGIAPPAWPRTLVVPAIPRPTGEPAQRDIIDSPAKTGDLLANVSETPASREALAALVGHHQAPRLVVDAEPPRESKAIIPRLVADLAPC